MKMFRSFLVTGCLATAFATGPVAAQVCGDFNDDGQRSIADALFLSNCIANANCPPASATTDVFEDSAVNNTDLATLVDALAGIETLFDLCEGPGSNLVGCPGTVTINSSTISTSQRWPAGCTVKLNGTVFVSTPAGGPTTVLTIDPGVTVQGIKGSVDPAALIFLPGSKINAQGSAASPIVFTSDQAPGSRGKGDWAGLSISGRSTVNRPNCLANAEGLPTAFGGCDATDSSGIARYVRVEYCGLQFTPNNELNVFTMNGVGSGTILDHIEAQNGSDDCFEWFGGTVNMHHLVAASCADDGFDWQLGYTGAVQYGLMLQNGQITDATIRDGRGMEGDNSEFGNDDLPRSNPKFCNMTLVGGQDTHLACTGPGTPFACCSGVATGACDNGGSDAGILLRRGTAGQIANTIVTGFQDAGVEIRDSATTLQACTDMNADQNPEALAGNLLVQNSIFFSNGQNPANCTAAGIGGGGTAETCCTGAGTGTCTYAEHPKSGTISGCTTCGCDRTDEWYALLVAGTSVSNANGSNATNPGQSRVYPATGALYNAVPTGTLISPMACSTLSDTFTNPSYVGAFDPAASCAGATCDWMSQPWVSFDVN